MSTARPWVGNQLPILLIDFVPQEIVGNDVGNQLPILLIDFYFAVHIFKFSWESVTNPLDRLPELPTGR